MALPLALDPVNLWRLRYELHTAGGRIQGGRVVDYRISPPERKTQEEAVFVTELDGLPILGVGATYMHFDHTGLSHWLSLRWNTASQECRTGLQVRSCSNAISTWTWTRRALR